MFFTAAHTLKAIYGDDYRSVKLFSFPHIMEILITIIVCIVVAKIYKKAKNKHKFFVFITTSLLVDELIKHVVALATKQWDVCLLPLQLCSINIFVCTINTFKPSKFTKEILYGLCLPGACIAMLISTWLVTPVFNIFHLHSYLAHLLLILYSILLLVDGYKPDIKMIPKLLIFLVALCIPIYFINLKLGTNFFFLNKPYDNVASKFLSSILGEKYFVFGYPVLLLIVWLVMYLPYQKRTK